MNLSRMFIIWVQVVLIFSSFSSNTARANSHKGENLHSVYEKWDTLVICNLSPYGQYTFDPVNTEFWGFRIYSDSNELIIEGNKDEPLEIPLTKGDYKFHFYDDSMNLKEIRYTHIAERQSEIKQCDTVVILPCNSEDVNINPDNLFPLSNRSDSSSCSCAFDYEDQFDREVLYQGIDRQGRDYLTLRFTNYTKCNVCEVTYYFQKERCNFPIDFYYVGLTNFKNNLWIDSVIPTSLCGPEVWKFYDENDIERNFEFSWDTFPLPYSHKLMRKFTFSQNLVRGKFCFTACKCICGTMDTCCKTICKNIVFGEPFREDEAEIEWLNNFTISNKAIRIVPNPTSDYFELKNNTDEKTYFEYVHLINPLGVTVKEWKLTDSEMKYNLGIEIKSGTYYIEFKESDSALTQKKKVIIY